MMRMNLAQKFPDEQRNLDSKHPLRVWLLDYYRNQRLKIAKGGGHGSEAYEALKECIESYLGASKDKYNSSKLDKSKLQTFHQEVDNPLARPKSAVQKLNQKNNEG